MVSYLVGGELRKSCALCSRLAGEHVFHPIPEFGWHCPNRDDGMPYPQSECTASWRPRVEAGVTTTAHDLTERLAGFPIAGLRCSALTECDRPRPPHDPAIAELLNPMREEAAERLPASPRERACDKPRAVKSVLDRVLNVEIDRSRPSREYDWHDSYASGDQLTHPKFGLGVVVQFDQRSIVVAFEGEDKLRVLVHHREVIVLPELVDLILSYGAPLDLGEIAAYCGISQASARRQLDVLLSDRCVARAGDLYVRTSKETRAA